MTHLQAELFRLKTDITEMWKLVRSQLQKSQYALSNFDKNIASEVITNEKIINALELKIDRDCEDIFALFNPVAVDLRFVLAVLKINTNLERIGDIAEGMARYTMEIPVPFDEKLLSLTKIFEMYDEATHILNDVLTAFEEENTKLARGVFKRDEILNNINLEATVAITRYIQNNPDKIEPALHILSAIKKLERLGDQCKNIAEEIIFYVEAKVLKHKETL